MNLSYTTFSVQDKGIWEALDIARQYGLEGIELRGRDMTHVSPSCPFAYVSGIKSALKEKGLKVPCLTAYTRFHQPSEKQVYLEADKLMETVRLAEYLEAESIRVFMGDVPEGMERDKADEIARQGLFYTAEKLKGSPVRLAIETHDSVKDGKSMRRILQGIPVSIGVLLDIIHPWDKQEDIHETWDCIGERIFHVHIKDLERQTEAGRIYGRIGEGLLPVRETVAFLEHHGYRGFYSLEWEKSAVTGQGVTFQEQLESFVTFMRREENGNHKNTV